MKFRKMKELLFRLKLEKSGFYDEVSFESKEAEKNLRKLMAEWLFRLKSCKKIRIEAFKDLFRELKEIEFPIKIKECYGWFNFYITIIDNKGTVYYMSKLDSISYNQLEDYNIAKREEIIPEISFIERNFHYKFSPNGIILKEMEIWKSNKHDNYPDTKVKLCFNSEEHTTEAILFNPYTSKDNMKIKYPTMDGEFDQKIQEYLFDVNEKFWYYYDVFHILEWMLSVISSQNVTISIVAEVDDEIYSEIDVVQGIVQRYTKTEIISEGERRTEIEVLAKKLEDFLAEKK